MQFLKILFELSVATFIQYSLMFIFWRMKDSQRKRKTFYTTISLVKYYCKTAKSKNSQTSDATVFNSLYRYYICIVFSFNLFYSRGSRNKKDKDSKLCGEVLLIESFIEIVLTRRSIVWVC